MTSWWKLCPTRRQPTEAELRHVRRLLAQQLAVVVVAAALKAGQPEKHNDLLLAEIDRLDLDWRPLHLATKTFTAKRLTTPEFQLSSETNVMRQGNLISSAIFNPSTGLQSSFRSGSGVIGMDLTRWMGARTGGSGLWTDTRGGPDLLSHLSAELGAPLAWQAP